MTDAEKIVHLENELSLAKQHVEYWRKLHRDGHNLRLESIATRLLAGLAARRDIDLYDDNNIKQAIEAARGLIRLVDKLYEEDDDTR